MALIGSGGSFFRLLIVVENGGRICGGVQNAAGASSIPRSATDIVVDRVRIGVGQVSLEPAAVPFLQLDN